jgi:Predicted AAA-ATPase/PD-(D/E)XK nuclease superfamily
MVQKKLPIGIQEFTQFKEAEYLYIDKTEHVFNIINEGRFYFLSRPRRFGKSLLLSTMKEVFKGNQSLFEGLWIYNKWDWSQKYPVIHLSFATSGYREIGLTRAVFGMIEWYAYEFEVTLTQEGNALRFKELLYKIHEKHGSVVVLIDEYDKAIVDYIDDVAQANENRDILRDFYVVLKDNTQYLRFVFITGITKFSRVSIFSALNHLNDISMNDKYATLTGYTQAELEHYFTSYFPEAETINEMSHQELLAELKFWYNGYSWNGKDFVYNPFSILKFFAENRFYNFWFSTGTPTFLSVLARNEQFYDLDAIETDQTSFDTFDMGNLNAEAVMFQTGYLTVKKYNRREQIYTLGYPNNEVRKAFLEYMIEAYTFVQVNAVPPTVIKMRRAFERKDIQTVIELVNTMFANIPSHIFDGTSEKYFHSLMHILLNYLGTHIESEINTNKGRIDSVIHTPQYIYILEFKFDKTAEIALNDIKSRDYSEKYSHSDKEIIAVGINFSSKKKCIDDWVVLKT